MLRLHRVPILSKSILVWLGVSVLAGLAMGCGGGGGGGGNASNLPAASISSPTGTYFKEGENITFSGSATSAEGGNLSGSALVWESNLDGWIGTGETLITSALSAGEHMITLTATDSTGASGKTSLPTIRIAQTRFIKMGAQTTDVTDASNAFDGDSDTAATIMTPDSEYVYFKSYIGTDDLFFFKIRVGSVPISGSKLSIEGLAADGSWQFLSDVFLLKEKTATFKISNAQVHTDSEGYINLRACWVNGQNNGNFPIYEIWRIDPPFGGARTQDVVNAESAFDEDQASFATIATPWNPSASVGNQNFLHFKIYAGLGTTDTFAFNILMNAVGASQSFAIYVEDLSTAAPDDWKLVDTLSLDSNSSRTVVIPDAQDYLDENGYISLRGSWITDTTEQPAGSLEIHEIWREDPFFVGPKTTTDEQYDYSVANAVDGNDNTSAKLYFFWGEYDHYEFLHFMAFIGDVADCKFIVRAGTSSPGSHSELIVEAEGEPDKWSLIQRIVLDDDISSTTFDVHNVRPYINADGHLSVRVRWESDSDLHDLYIYEIRRETE